LFVFFKVLKRASPYVLIQSNQKSSQQKGFFAAPAFAPQIGQNHGLESFALCARSLPRFCKISYALAAHRPPLFCPLSPEAVLPDTELWNQGHQENPKNPVQTIFALAFPLTLSIIILNSIYPV
jgi:hypothetical protein